MYNLGVVKEQTIEEVYSWKNNSFNLVRLLLAVAVIYSHCFPLLGKEEYKADFLERITSGQISFGSLAVYCFFVISGFLITQSMINSKSYINYFIKRILRIFPAFFVALFFSGFIIGPLVSTLTIKEYFSISNIIEPIKFIFYNLSMNIFQYSWGFLDVFSNNPFPASVNGSMWTLKHEVACYIIVALLSYFYIFRNRLLLIGSTLIVTLLAITNIINEYRLFSLSNKYWILSAAEYNSFIVLLCYFMMGSVIYIFKDKIIINNRFLMLTTIGIFISCKLGILKLSLIFLLPYLLIVLCIIYKVHGITKYGDFSYGMYIYAFPIQQALTYFYRDKLNLFVYCILSISITFIISFISWKFIEKPMLNLKNKI